MKGKVVAIACVWAGLMFVGCTDSHRNLYSEFHSLYEDGWRYGTEVFFTPVHADSLCNGRFVVALRHDNTYPYTDIRLEVTHWDDDTHRHDTVDISLAGPYGQWLGSGIGMSFQVVDTLHPSKHPSGTMVKLRHLMRTDTLRGINQVGLFFVPD